jgi:hypothetical protein
LRFAQSPALGRKVSDEFTVPLCRRLAILLWRLRRATTMETGLFEIEAEHLRDYRQSRELLLDSRDVIHAVCGPTISAGRSTANKIEAVPNSGKKPMLSTWSSLAAFCV